MKKSATAMVHTLPITKARINLGAVVKRVHLNKEYVILEKDGIPIAGIMDIDEFEDYLELQDPSVQRQIAQGNEDIKAGRTRPVERLLAKFAPKPKASAKRRSKV